MIEEATLGGAPALVTGRPGRATVLVYHGLNGDKSLHISEIEKLAAAGYLGVSVDAVDHGDRRSPDLLERLDDPSDEVDRYLGRIAVATAAEIPSIEDDVAGRGWGDGPICVIGISLGGFVAYRAPIECEGQVSAVVAITSTPLLPGGGPDSPHLHPAAFDRTAVLSLVGGDDDDLDPSGSEEFAEVLRSRRPDGSTVGHHVYPDSAHMMHPDDWEDAWERIIEWLHRHT